MTTPTPVRLEGWAVTEDRPSPYAAPEQASKRLSGRAYGHPLAPDGKVISSSRIVSVDGRTVTTLSGTVYRLGVIAPKYRAWLRENGIAYDPKQPVRIVRRPA